MWRDRSVPTSPKTRSRRDRRRRCRRPSAALEPRRFSMSDRHHDDPPSPFIVEWVEQAAGERLLGRRGARRGDGTRPSRSSAGSRRLPRLRRRLADRRRSARGAKSCRGAELACARWFADLTCHPLPAARIRARSSSPATCSAISSRARSGPGAGRRGPVRDVHGSAARISAGGRAPPTTCWSQASCGTRSSDLDVLFYEEVGGAARRSRGSSARRRDLQRREVLGAAATRCRAAARHATASPW